MTVRTHRRRVVFGLASTIALAGCSGSRGWFGNRTTEDSIAPKGGYQPINQDRRPMIRDISSLRVEPTPGGVIVQATGLADGPGWWDADLVQVAAVTPESSVLQLEFRARPPVTVQQGGPSSLREVHAGTYIPNADLGEVRTITVSAASTSRSSRR